jgi:hypothetical protein
MSQNLIAAPADCTNTNTCPITESIAKNWNLAVSTCQNLSTNNYFDWYLPTYNELGYLYDYRVSNVEFLWDSNFMVGANYWSSTLYDNDNSKAWLKNFGTKEENNQGGNPAVAPKTSNFYVRCVRTFN